MKIPQLLFSVQLLLWVFPREKIKLLKHLKLVQISSSVMFLSQDLINFHSCFFPKLLTLNRAFDPKGQKNCRNYPTTCPP